jgi:hypothetical protein
MLNWSWLEILLFSKTQTSCDAYPTSYSVCSFLGIKQRGQDADHSSAASAEA